MNLIKLTRLEYHEPKKAFIESCRQWYVNPLSISKCEICIEFKEEVPITKVFFGENDFSNFFVQETPEQILELANKNKEKTND